MSVSTECEPPSSPSPSSSRAPLRVATGLPTKSGTKFVPRQAIYARYMSSSLNLADLAGPIREFVEENAKILKPAHVHVCDGSEDENRRMIKMLQDMGRLKKLEKYDNW